MNSKMDDLAWEISRKKTELEKLEKELHTLQRNTVFDNLKKDHYYSLSTDKSWYSTNTTYYFKYDGNNVSIENNVGEYLYINGPYIEKYSFSRKESEEYYKTIEQYKFCSDLEHYLSDREVYINELSDEDLKELKKALRALVNHF